MAKRACLWVPGHLPGWAQKFVVERPETNAPPSRMLPAPVERNKPVTTRRVVYVLEIDEVRLRRLLRRRQKAAKKARLAPRVAEQRAAIEARREYRVA